MAEFMVTIDTSGVDDLPEPDRAEVIRRERAAGRSLMASGTLVSIWRLPGQRGNVGVWAAGDADDLHGVLESLPIFPHARFEVRALATHPLVAEADERPG